MLVCLFVCLFVCFLSAAPSGLFVCSHSACNASGADAVGSATESSVGNHRPPASVRAFLFVCRRFVAPRPLRSIPYSSSRNLRRHSRYPHPDSRCLYLIHDRSYPYSHHVYRYSHYSYSYSHNCTVLGIICTASRFCATKWSLPVGPSRASDNLQRWLQPRVLVIKAAWVGGAFSARLYHIYTETGLAPLTTAPGPR